MKNDQTAKYVRKQNLKTFCMKLVFVSKKKCLLDHFLELTAKGSTAVVFCFWQALWGNMLQKRRRGKSDKLHNAETLAADSN